MGRGANGVYVILSHIFKNFKKILFFKNLEITKILLIFALYLITIKMAKKKRLDLVIDELRKEMNTCRDLSIKNFENTSFYFYDSMSEHLRNLIQEVAKIRDLLNLDDRNF